MKRVKTVFFLLFSGIFLFIILLNSGFCRNPLSVENRLKIEKKFIEDLLGELPIVGDIKTLRDIIIAIYYGNYDEALKKTAESKLEGKIKNVCPVYSVAKLEKIVINYYKEKLDQAVVDRMYKIYKNLTPIEKQRILRGDKNLAWEVALELEGEERNIMGWLLSGWGQKEAILDKFIAFVRDMEEQKRAYERFIKRWKRYQSIMKARLYVKCVFSFRDSKTGDYEDVTIIIKKNGKEISKRSGYGVINLTLKRLMEGEEYEIVYLPGKFFKEGSIKLTAKDIPLKNKRMSMEYKTFKIQLKPTEAYEKYLKEEKLKEEKLKEDYLEARKELKDRWPERVACKERVWSEYEKALQDIKEGNLSQKQFDQIYEDLFHELDLGCGLGAMVESPPLEGPFMCRFYSYCEYVDYMKKKGKKIKIRPSEYIETCSPYWKKQEEIGRKRAEQWVKWKKEFSLRYQSDIKQLENEAKKLYNSIQSDREILYKQINSLFRKFMEKFSEKEQALSELKGKLKESVGSERLEILNRMCDICYQQQELEEDFLNKFNAIADEWIEKKHSEWLKPKYFALLTFHPNWRHPLLSMSKEDAQAFFQEVISDTPKNLLQKIIRDMGMEDILGKLTEGALTKCGVCDLYNSELNVYYTLYNGIYPNELYSWCKRNFSKIEPLEPNIQKLAKLITYKKNLIWYRKHYKDWEIYRYFGVLEEFINLLNSSTDIISPLVNNSLFLEKVLNYYKRTGYHRAVLEGEKRVLVSQFFHKAQYLSTIAGAIPQGHLYPPSVFNQLINQIKAETSDIIKEYLKIKDQIDFLREAGSNYYKLKQLSSDVEKNWMEILRIHEQFLQLKSKNDLLRHLKEDEEKLFSDISPKLKAYIDQQISYLNSLLSKVKAATDESELLKINEEYINYRNKNFNYEVFKQNFSYLPFKEWKKLIMELSENISKKFEQFRQKEYEKKLVSEIKTIINNLKIEKRNIEDIVKRNPSLACSKLDEFLNKIFHATQKIEKFLQKSSSSQLERLLNVLENLKNWADSLYSKLQLKINAKSNIYNLYTSFARYYADKNLGALLDLISSEWSAPDGTTIDEVEEILENSFDVFDRIEYKIKNFRIESLKNDKFRVYYENEIIGYIFRENIIYKESYKVVEEVGIENGKFKILKTIQGQFWKR